MGSLLPHHSHISKCAASRDHWTHQYWTFKSCKVAAVIPADCLGWNLFLFPVLWSNLLGFIRGHFNAKVLISGWSHHPPPLLKKTHFLYFLCFHVYITLCFSPLQMSSTLKSTSAGVPSLWDNGTRPLCALWINHHSVYSKLIINYSTDTFPQASLVEERSEHTTRD